jgi:D-serine deaminase-like pyridoxal phosphate-dependent protein
MIRTYDYYRRALEGHPLPLAFVDLDAFDQNASDIARRAQGRRIRTASKSLRSVALI